MPNPNVQLSDIIAGFFAFEFGEVEFTELALEHGASLEKIKECLAERREEDRSDF
jgi:hypothetical protein